MTQRTTSALSRLDMMLAQAERFVDNNLPGEAVARAKQVIAYADRELRRAPDGSPDRAAYRARRLLAEGLVQRLGASVRDRRGALRVSADDALHPKAWA
ncbi:MAG: hypothetical protein ACFCGT_24285 [Sandaracinaceae bacterium]